MNPCSSNSSDCVLSSQSSRCVIRYKAWEVGFIPGNTSISYATSPTCAKLGTSSGNMSTNSLTTLDLTTLWWLQVWPETPCNLSQLVFVASNMRSNFHLYLNLCLEKRSSRYSCGEAAFFSSNQSALDDMKSHERNVKSLAFFSSNPFQRWYRAHS